MFVDLDCFGGGSKGITRLCLALLLVKQVAEHCEAMVSCAWPILPVHRFASRSNEKFTLLLRLSLELTVLGTLVQLLLSFEEVDLVEQSRHLGGAGAVRCV